MERLPIPTILGLDDFDIRAPKWDKSWPQVKTPLLGCVMAIFGRYIYFDSAQHNRLIFLRYLNQSKLKVRGKPTTDEVWKAFMFALTDKFWQPNRDIMKDKYMYNSLSKFLDDWYKLSWEYSGANLYRAHQRDIISDWIRDIAIIFHRGKGWMDICPSDDSAVIGAFAYLNEKGCKYATVKAMINDSAFAGRRTELYWYLCQLNDKLKQQPRR